MIGARTRHYQQSNTANMTNAPSNRSRCGHRHRRRFPRRRHRSRRRHVHDAPCKKHHAIAAHTPPQMNPSLPSLLTPSPCARPRQQHHAVAARTPPPATLRIPALSLTATVTVKYVYSESSSPASTNLDATGHPSQVRTRHHPAKQRAQQWPSQPGAELWYATANNIDHAAVACTKRPPSTDNIKQTPPPTPRHHHR